MADPKSDLAIAVAKLRGGDVVAFPTETVYGLGARIDNPQAIQKIFSTKARPFFDPLIVHVHSIEQAKECYTMWNDLADTLTKEFWPGPLTLVMKKSQRVSDAITSGLQNVGVRMPRHKLALELLKKIDIPLAAPSANKFGKTSPTSAQHVKKEFSDEVFVLESSEEEPCVVGIESTVLLIRDTKKISILRKGMITRTDIEICLNKNGIIYEWLDAVDKKESPGHMKHHYMPDIPFIVCRNPHMRLSEVSQILNERLFELPDEVEGVKMIKPKEKIEKIEFLRLSQEPAQAARELYAQLRAASARKPQALCFIQLPYHQTEIWESILDRLYKAASLIID